MFNPEGGFKRGRKKKKKQRKQRKEIPRFSQLILSINLTIFILTGRCFPLRMSVGRDMPLI